MAPSKDSRKQPTPQYTVIVRLPFPRGSFADPPQVDWTPAKDKRLWKLIARPNPKPSSAANPAPSASSTDGSTTTGGEGQGGEGDREGRVGAAEIDWPARAAEFGVDTAFLLRQAAWLYERHFSLVKAQMTRIRASSAAAGGNSPVVGTPTAGKKPGASFLGVSPRFGTDG
jgi:Atg29 N-terminal domain